MNPNLELAVDVVADPRPDERGNLMTAALFSNGRMIALTLNVN